MARTTVYNKGITNNFDLIGKENKKIYKDYINYCKANGKTETTMKTYTNILKIFFCWNFDNNDDTFFFKLKKRHIIEYFGYVRENLGASPNRIATHKSVLSALSDAMEILYEDEYPAFRNLTKGIDTSAITPVREKTVIQESEANSILQQLVDKEEYQLACYFALLMSSGCRKSELVQMKVNFFNPEHEVFGGYMYLTESIRSKGRGKEGKRIKRYVIKNSFEPYLDLWLTQREKENIHNDYLFVSRIGQQQEYHPATISNFNLFAQKITKDFGLNFYNHCLRHYFCTKLKRLNLPDDVIAEIMHWSGTDMVKIYNDISQEERLSQFFDETGFKEHKEASLSDVAEGFSKGNKGE